jgi:hypothetical protein
MKTLVVEDDFTQSTFRIPTGRGATSDMNHTKNTAKSHASFA